MQKLVVFVLGILTFNLVCLNVKADEIYYTNANNVSMTKQQYDYFVELADEEYPNVVTQEVYDKFVNNGFFTQPIEKQVYDEDAVRQQEIIPSVIPRGTVHETQAKKLVLGKTCGTTTCDITVTLTWKGQPVIKSWDVIGAYLYGNLNLASNILTTLTYSGGNIAYDDPYYTTGGFGTSVKLRTSSTNMRAYQSYDVYGTGTVFASYQHATSNISKSTSHLFTIGAGGYGGVFYFYGAASNVYDQMGGVNVGVSI